MATITPSDNVPSSIIPTMHSTPLAPIALPAVPSPLLPIPSSPLSDLSEFSRSPTPPGDFGLIDCDSSCDSSMLSSVPSSMETSPTPESSQMSSNSSDDRPTKRRRISAESKVRSTQLLDLRSDGVPEHQTEQFDKLMKLLQNKQKIVVVAGAGISVSAGSK
jgi:NAD-dependent histone deacetylase SIR2